MSDDPIELVEAYIDAGLPVLPLHAMRDGACTCRNVECTSAAKHPLTRNGKDDATTDPGTVAEWAARWPGCNWGVRPPEDVVVLDVDLRNDGDTTLARLEDEHGELPETLTAVTGSGGLHLWLSYRGPARGKIGPGIDVKTHSGYLVAPPSVHACGGAYEWLTQVPAAYAPAWVKALLNPPVRRYPVRTGAGGTVDGLVRFVAASPEGQRNQRLYWAACRAHEAGTDPVALVDAAVAIGLDHMSVEATVNSASNAGPRRATRHPASDSFRTAS